MTKGHLTFNSLFRQTHIVYNNIHVCKKFKQWPTMIVQKRTTKVNVFLDDNSIYKIKSRKVRQYAFGTPKYNQVYHYINHRTKSKSMELPIYPHIDPVLTHPNLLQRQSVILK